MTALLMLRSPIETVSAPAISPFRGSITHPTQQLCTLRGRRLDLHQPIAPALLALSPVRASRGLEEAGRSLPQELDI
jgi:hypothetical protein